jgi:hypothetical protein
VRHDLTHLVLARTLDDASPLPTEPRLMEMFNVSRGTLVGPSTISFARGCCRPNKVEEPS